MTQREPEDLPDLPEEAELEELPELPDGVEAHSPDARRTAVVGEEPAFRNPSAQSPVPEPVSKPVLPPAAGPASGPAPGPGPAELDLSAGIEIGAESGDLDDLGDLGGLGDLDDLGDLGELGDLDEPQAEPLRESSASGHAQSSPAVPAREERDQKLPKPQPKSQHKPQHKAKQQARPRSEPIERRQEVLQELEPLALAASGSSDALPAAAADSAAPASQRSTGAEPRLPGAAPSETLRRDLDRAPLLLRKAALIVALGSIAPWASGHQLDWLDTLPAKAVLFLAAWIFHQSHVLTHHGKAPGIIAKLGKKGPLPVWILAGLVAVVGLMPILEGDFNFPNFSEKLILLLATFTFTHIYDYEHGGKFNPIFPLMFLAPAVGGIGGIVAVFSVNPVAGIGAILVTAGAFFACYTMGVALKQAKKEGDAKQAAQREARRASRETSKRSSSGGPGARARGSARRG